MFVFNSWDCDKVIIFGSSKNLITANHWKKRENTAWIMINHAWQIREKNNDWDRVVCTKQYLNGDDGDKNLKAHVDNSPRRYGDYMELLKYPTLRKKYLDLDQATNGTMFFNACYYGIEMYQPSKIGFIGCDMDYEKYSEGEDNSFFGVSTPPFIDFKNKEGILSRLNNLEEFCKKENIELVNLSTADWTILPFKREEYEHF